MVDVLFFSYVLLSIQRFFESAMLTGNDVEVAAFIDLCPLGIIFAISNMIKSRKADFLDCYIIAIVIFLSIFAIIGFPTWLSSLHSCLL